MKKLSILLVVCMFSFINYTNSQTWTNYTKADGLLSNGVWTVAIDAQDNVWVGTHSGVSKFDDTTWTTYDASYCRTLDAITDIEIDKNGHIVIGAAVGFSEFDGTTWKTYRAEEDSGHVCSIESVAIDTLNNKWFGTGGCGLLKYDGTSWTYYRAPSDPISDRAGNVTIDAQGNKWLESNFCDGSWFLSDTSNYISKFDGTTWTHYTTQDLYCNWIYAIAIDAQGNKWIGTEKGGVLKFDGTTWTTYTTANGLADNKVNSIAIDAQGNKWFGTNVGVSKFDGTNWTTFYNSFGWEQNYIYDMAIDNQGNIWLTTHGGVLKLSDVITEITTTINKNLLTLYPNPVQDVLYLNLSGKTGELHVFDFSGKCLLQEQITENESSVDVSGLGNGIYFVRVMHDKKVFTGKIVKY